MGRLCGAGSEIAHSQAPLGSGGKGEGTKAEGRRELHLQRASRGFKGALRGLQGRLKAASPSEGFKGLDRGLVGGLKRASALKGASRRLEGGFKGASLLEGFNGV